MSDEIKRLSRENERLRDLLVRAADAVKPKAHWSHAGAMWLELFATLDALRDGVDMSERR